jgi:predicted alpha/beta hydrolase
LNPVKINIYAADGTALALWHLKPSAIALGKHLIIYHGTFSNKDSCLPLAHYFAGQGYDCYILEWRGHGASESPKNKFDIETVALQDYPVVFDYLFHKRGIQKLSTLSHSGGGLCLAMCLIKYPEYLDKISSSVLFACQGFGAITSTKSFLKILMGKWAAKLVGFIPGPLNGLGPHNETYHFMRPWFQWNLKRRFIGADDFDYGKRLPQINYPILSLAGTGDHFIAPEQGCHEFLEAFQNPDNRLQLCGISEGFSEDYDHARVFLSSTAAQEIWPLAQDWIAQNH